MPITLEEAIAGLTWLRDEARFPKNQHDLDVLTLGIEALKRVKEARKKVYFTSRSLLPGETKQ